MSGRLGLLSPFYADDAAFDDFSQQSAQLLKLLMDMGTDRGYSPKPDKSLFISDIPGQDEAARRKFEKDGLVFNFVSGSRYLGAYLGPEEKLAAWIKSQGEAWAHGLRVLGKIA